MVEDKDVDTYASAPTAAASPATAATQQGFQSEYSPVGLAPAGYQLGALLGRGGMGEVIAAHDNRVGREVAYKRMRDHNASADALSRFLREARIQARLDHPAIVPVYELGEDADGRPFFTMKRLAGKTLAERMLSSSEPLQPLLRAFAEVCLAIELAHSKGIVHRDLKPSNIMLGDFGEVYVLDWGIARVLAERPTNTSAEPIGDLDSIGQATKGGTLLGTLGYMAPEQVRGEEVDGKADVYALGSILFEMLAGEGLHPHGHAAVASTLSMPGATPTKRRPDRTIPPELDALCSAMLVARAADRPTARDVAQRVQQYLDGDRDLEARRELAQTHLAEAREALASGDPQRRADALRAAGRALALDPKSTAAAALVTGLIVEPPTELPAELIEKLAAQDVMFTKQRAKRAMTGYGSLLSLSIVLLFFDVASWVWLGAIYAGIVAFVVLSYVTYRTGRARVSGVLLGTLLMAVLFSRAASPFILVPMLLCGTMLAVSNIPWLNDRPAVFYVWMAVCALVPFLLEWASVLTTTAHVTPDAIEIKSAIFAPGGSMALYLLAVTNVLFLLIVARFALVLARDRRSAQRRLTMQAWHLGQLLPETPQVVAAPHTSRV